MGNSLLDVIVFGRRAGTAAAQTAKSRTGELKCGLAHLERWRAELKKAGIRTEVKSPLLLPDYTRKTS
jgi:succinate dehydrogenase/fumarate reductase flavoprotein subunit